MLRNGVKSTVIDFLIEASGLCKWTENPNIEEERCGHSVFLDRKTNAKIGKQTVRLTGIERDRKIYTDTVIKTAAQTNRHTERYIKTPKNT